MSAVVLAFADEAAPAQRLAEALGVELRLADVHAFPDGEVLPTVPPPARTVLLYRSLDRPNAKLLPLLLTADALRRAGAGRLVLVAPYLCYLRQDTVFARGQPVSRDVIGRLLGDAFDRLITVDPHLHRTPSLTPVFRDRPVSVVSAAEVLAGRLGQGGGAVVLGPDVESEPWAAALGAALGAPHATLRKARSGDRAVRVSPPPAELVEGRRVILADDIASSGMTLVSVAEAALGSGAASVEVAVSHGLFEPGALERLRAAGVSRIVCTDSCAGAPDPVFLAAALAAALADES